jgi:circadian clock protein KaiC
MIRELAKASTGIAGVDAVTMGGLPRGRPTLVCGSAGSGKTLFAMEFLVRGATQFGEPGVFVAFEETAQDLTENVRSLGFDLDQLSAENKLLVDYVHVEPGELEENGEYDLEGLFIRLGYAIDTIGAKRVVLDTVEALFGGLTNQGILRAELRRLFRWLKDKGVTAVITGERGEGALTRNGLEEYVSDCVILLDHRVADQVTTRRLRIVKYRGSLHGTNEYPFLIDENGFSVLPITGLSVDYPTSVERVSSGIPGLDAMLGGAGIYRGSSVLISGTAGTGKSSLAAHFAQASCLRGERCLYFAFEEGMSQIVRNMRAIGLDLGPCLDQGMLHVIGGRPTLTGLEMHLATMNKWIERLEPRMVVIDPISNLADAGTTRDASALLTRLFDLLKRKQITAVMTNLTSGEGVRERTEIGMSSAVDTWLLLRDIELGGERNRGIYVLKSRGMAHSNQIREFLITSHGVELLEVYSGPEGVLTGSMRLAQEAVERAEEQRRRLEFERQRRALVRRKKELEDRLATLRAELEEQEAELAATEQEERLRERRRSEERRRMAQSRGADAPERGNGDGKKGAHA